MSDTRRSEREAGPGVGLVAVTRGVSRSLPQCALSHLPRLPIDYDRAVAQHAAYEQELEKLGVHLQSLPAEHEQPDAVFVEDAALVLDELAVMTRPSLPHRGSEHATLEPVLARYRPIASLQEPARLEGGDVLRLGRRLYLGLSRRTSAEGAAQLRALTEPLGYEVRTVPVEGCLHLKSAVTAVGPDRLLANPDWVDTTLFQDMSITEVPPAEPMAANALLVRDTVLVPASFPATAERLAAAGLRVATLDVSELQKAEAGVTCCSLLFEASPASTSVER